jgi:phosphatidylserine decarboxylase
MRLHSEGRWHILAASIIFFVILVAIYQLFPNNIWFYITILPFFLIWLWVFWFFRIPTRNFVTDESAVFSPCDGKVVVIEEVYEPEYFKDKRLQISVFMSPLNVHNNIYPISGKVLYSKYHEGKYLVAWHPKSSTENERSTVVVEGKRTTVLMRQIAGALARRIVTYAEEGQHGEQNTEFGFIKFGSRVDVYLPLGTKVDCKIDDIVQGGISRLATV